MSARVTVHCHLRSSSPSLLLLLPCLFFVPYSPYHPYSLLFIVFRFKGVCDLLHSHNKLLLLLLLLLRGFSYFSSFSIPLPLNFNKQRTPLIKKIQGLQAPHGATSIVLFAIKMLCSIPRNIMQR